MATGGHCITITLIADCITMFLPSCFYVERCYGILLYTGFRGTEEFMNMTSWQRLQERKKGRNGCLYSHSTTSVISKKQLCVVSAICLQLSRTWPIRKVNAIFKSSAIWLASPTFWWHPWNLSKVTRCSSPPHACCKCQTHQTKHTSEQGTHWGQYKFSCCVLCREVFLFSEVQSAVKV